jgi:hypothetical protein
LRGQGLTPLQVFDLSDSVSEQILTIGSFQADTA